jgi:AraC-like DNA-binding protein
MSASPLPTGRRHRRDVLRRLEAARDWLAAHFDEPVSLRNAAHVACCSPYHFHRQFTALFGETPQEYVARLKLQEAKRLLVTTALPVAAVCGKVGYSSLGTFSTQFRRREGASPTEYRYVARTFYRTPDRSHSRFIPYCFLGRFAPREATGDDD